MGAKLRSIINLLITALVFVSSAALLAEAISVEEIKDIQKKMKSSKYLTVDFSQQSYSASRKRTATSLGRLHCTKPVMFRWMIIKPVPNEWIYDGNQACNYIPDEKLAVCYKSMASMRKNISEIVQLVTNVDSLLSRYNIIKAEMNPKYVMMELSPKTKMSVEKLVIHLDMKKNFISYLKLFYVDKNHSTFVFSNPQHKINDSTLYQVPKGVKVSDGF